MYDAANGGRLLCDFFPKPKECKMTYTKCWPTFDCKTAYQPQNDITGGQLSSAWVDWSPWPGVARVRSVDCAAQFSASPQIKCRNKLVLIARLTFTRTKRYKLTRKLIFIITHYSLLWARAGEMIRICSSEALPWNSCNFKIAFALLFFSRDLSC